MTEKLDPRSEELVRSFLAGSLAEEPPAGLEQRLKMRARRGFPVARVVGGGLLAAALVAAATVGLAVHLAGSTPPRPQPVASPPTTAAPTATAAPTPPPVTAVTFSGALVGTLQNPVTDCTPSAPAPPASVQVTGTLNGVSYRLNVFDPSSPGWGMTGGQYVVLDGLPPGGGPSAEATWSDRSTTGITTWSRSDGATFDTTLSPVPNTAAHAAVHVVGSIVCPKPPTTDVTFSGAMTGDLTAPVISCDKHEVVGGTPFNTYIEVTGTLNGDAVTVDVYDPHAGGEYEQALHIMVDRWPAGPHVQPLSSWGVPASGITSFDATRSTSFSATLQPLSGQGQGTQQSSQPLTVSGTAICPAPPLTNDTVTSAARATFPPAPWSVYPYYACDVQQRQPPVPGNCPFTQRLLDRVTALEPASAWPDNYRLDPISLTQTGLGDRLTTTVNNLSSNSATVTVTFTSSRSGNVMATYRLTVVNDKGKAEVDDISFLAGGGSSKCPQRWVDIYSSQWTSAASC